MVLEIADYRIATDRRADFEAAMEELKSVIGSSPGYLGHTVQRCIETPTRYVMLVRWASLEAHKEGFHNTAGFAQWKARLASHRDGIVMEHFETVFEHDWAFSTTSAAD